MPDRDFVRSGDSRPEVSVVVPMYNEADNVRRFHRRCSAVLDGLGVDWEMICVNDGSADETVDRVLRVRESDERVKLLDLTRNFGKEVALAAGIDHALGDAVVEIDADLEHPPEVIEDLLRAWRNGADVVSAVRTNRRSQSVMRRFLARVFYRLFGRLTRTEGAEALGDFCLLDRRAVDAFGRIRERNRFTKGLVAWMGYRRGLVTYDLGERQAGSSKWSYWRLWNHALDGITAFSSAPLKLWTYIGISIAAICLLYATLIVARTLVLGIAVPGYASLMVAVLFMGGVQLISLGILGEYLSRVYSEVKHRPLYLVRGRYGIADYGVEIEDRIPVAVHVEDRRGRTQRDDGGFESGRQP
jgi:glycosyltransferase involved in cell wall biosynthesis